MHQTRRPPAGGKASDAPGRAAVAAARGGPVGFLALQRAAGNRAVAGLVVQRVHKDIDDDGNYTVDTDKIFEADYLRKLVLDMVGMGREDLVARLLTIVTAENNTDAGALTRDFQEWVDGANAVPLRPIRNTPNPFKSRADLPVGGPSKTRSGERMSRATPELKLIENLPVQELTVHKKSKAAFLAAEVGQGFTGVVQMSHRGDETRGKVFLFPAAPHDSYPTRRWPDSARAKVYGTEYTGAISHQAGIKPSHAQLVEHIEDATSMKTGERKGNQWNDDSWEEGQREHSRIGFTVIKVARGTHRFSFTSTSMNSNSFRYATESAISPEDARNQSRYPPQDWAAAVVTAIDALG
jgi:hypothetical protein